MTANMKRIQNHVTVSTLFSSQSCLQTLTQGRQAPLVASDPLLLIGAILCHSLHFLRAPPRITCLGHSISTTKSTTNTFYCLCPSGGSPLPTTCATPLHQQPPNSYQPLAHNQHSILATQSQVCSCPHVSDQQRNVGCSLLTHCDYSHYRDLQSRDFSPSNTYVYPSFTCKPFYHQAVLHKSTY